MRAEDFMQDIFEDTRIVEARLIRETMSELQSIDAQIVMTNRAQAIQHTPGWQDFMKSVAEALDRAVSDLVNTTKSNEYMRQQQGRVQALRDVATMLTKGKNLLEELAKRRALVQDRLTELLKRAPRQRQEQT